MIGHSADGRGRETTAGYGFARSRKDEIDERQRVAPSLKKADSASSFSASSFSAASFVSLALLAPSASAAFLRASGSFLRRTLLTKGTSASMHCAARSRRRSDNSRSDGSSVSLSSTVYVAASTASSLSGKGSTASPGQHAHFPISPSRSRLNEKSFPLQLAATLTISAQFLGSSPSDANVLPPLHWVRS